MTKTAPSKPIIAMVFDFDDTLAPDTTSSFLESIGVEPRRFWTEGVRPLLDQGWDPMAAQFYCLLEQPWSPEAGKQRITRDALVSFGRSLQPFEGVPELFEKLKGRVKNVSPDIQLEFYIISCGIDEIIKKFAHLQPIQANLGE